MVNYTCEKCFKIFSQKSHYNNHLKKKNPCQNNEKNQKKIIENFIKKEKKMILFHLKNFLEEIKLSKMEDINNVEENQINNTQYTFIEVCSGAGGLSKGFIDEGFKPLLLNDNNKYCIETLRLNHPDVNIEKCSMVDLDLEKYKEKNIDVLMGGVPCQSFSQAGKRKGISDERGKLIIHFIKMISILNPKVFIIENVQGLVTHNKGKTIEMVIDEINKIGKYVVKYKVLNSNDYSVPQNRKRLIIVGVNEMIKKTFNFPTPHEYKPVLKDVLLNCPESPGAVYNQDKYDIMQLVPEGGCWVDIPEEIAMEYMGKSYYSGGGKRGILKRLDMKKPCLTLLTTPSQKQTERCHPIETRPLQTLEYARIQTFPDNYEFYGSINQIYKQIGNAVPVNLSKALAKEVIEVLKN